MKQGCVLAPTLFILFFSMMLQQTTEDLNDEEGIYICFCTKRRLFNLRHLQAHTKTIGELIRELLFADDDALFIHMESVRKWITSCLADTAQLLGWKSAYRRLKSAIRRPLKKSTNHVVYPLMRQNWNQSISSTTWGSWSPLTPGSTRKLSMD